MKQADWEIIKKARRDFARIYFRRGNKKAWIRFQNLGSFDAIWAATYKVPAPNNPKPLALYQLTP